MTDTPEARLIALSQKDWEAEVRELADLLIWAASTTDEEWGYATDASPTSAYAKWIELMSPERVLAALDKEAATND